MSDIVKLLTWHLSLSYVKLAESVPESTQKRQNKEVSGDNKTFPPKVSAALIQTSWRTPDI